MRSNRKLFVGLIVVCSIICFTGCINLKSDHIKSQYYRLNNNIELSSVVERVSIDKSIFIKSFGFPSELATNKIAIIEDDNNLNYLNYHI